MKSVRKQRPVALRHSATSYGLKSKSCVEMGFSLSEFSDKFPSGIVEALEDEGFDNLPAPLSADRHDTDGPKLKKSHVAFVSEATKTLQIQHGAGPLRTTVSTGRGDMAGPNLVRILGSLTVAAEGAQSQCTAGGCH